MKEGGLRAKQTGGIELATQACLDCWVLFAFRSTIILVIIINEIYILGRSLLRFAR